jgi:hypothetical protein
VRRKSIVYSGSAVEVVEYPAVVISGDILAKTLYVYLGDLEKALYSGLIPLTKPVVLGSTGVVRVIEVLSDRTEYTGKYYTVAPLGEWGVLSVTTNGILSNYASLDDSYLEEELTSPQPHDALRPLLNHVVSLASKCEEPVLVEGCGLVGVSLGTLLGEANLEVQLYCETDKRNAYTLGLDPISHTSNLSKKWRTVVVTSLNAASKYRVMRELEYGNLVISAFSLTEWIPVRRNYTTRVSVVGVERVVEVEELAWKSKKVLYRLSRAIKVVRAGDLDSAKGLIPPRGLGTVVALD